jgi:hypothetical protein
MKKIFLLAIGVSLSCLRFSAAAESKTPGVMESARNVPVAYEVDVVVVGGSTGGVAAAVAAAKAGAKVFLVASRPYLGDDVAATLRLWLEEGEQPTAPLAKALFAASPEEFGPDENRLELTYEASLVSDSLHKDTKPPSLLNDGKWGSASGESVQFSRDVEIVADLKKAQPIEAVRVMAHQRAGPTGFRVANVVVSTSDDKKTWQKAAAMDDRSARETSGGGGDPSVTFSAKIQAQARYVKLEVKKDPEVSRMLLGEIEVIGPAAKQPKPPSSVARLAKPFHIKKVLDDALLEAGVPFLYSSYATDVLRDSEGNPCGIVMANRAGRQAVVAKLIIDATDRAWVARMAGAPFRPSPGGPQVFKRVVIGGAAKEDKNMSARTLASSFRVKGKTYNVIEYTLQLPLDNATYASLARAEQLARDMTYHPEQEFASDVLFQAPSDSIKGEKPGATEWKGVEGLEIQAFQPAGISRLWVAGMCGDIPRSHAERLARPMALIDLGARIGVAAAAEAKTLPNPKGVKIPGGKVQPVASGDVREVLVGIRPTQKLPTIPQEARPLPVLAKYDVVVVGGGTSGASAGIGAARRGAKVLVIEYLYGLGGVGTQGAISKYYYGYRGGFTQEVAGGGSWKIESRMEWWRSALRAAGADVWFGSIGCGTFVDRERVCGVVVATPQGRGVVLAKVVIDATGNADIAAAAGAACLYTDETDIAMQGTGLPPRELGASYTNTDFTITDETDMVDVSSLFVYAKDKYNKDTFDMGQLVDTRERRRIVGDYVLSVLDEMTSRTYPDTIAQASTNYDTHGYTIDPLFNVQHPDHRLTFRVYIPYRCLLPKGMDGLLVVGLGVSAHRDAIPLIRMQPDLQNMGYAAGVAAAMAAKGDLGTRSIDIRALQKHLVEIKNLPASVLTDEDSYPLPAKAIAATVENISNLKNKNRHKDAATILANPEQSLPPLRKAYKAAQSDEDKLTYAQILGLMGDAAGVQTLIAAVETSKTLDTGWNFRAQGQFGSNMSRLDTLILALGRTRDRRATPVIVEKLKLLDPSQDFSHHRAIALALEALGDPAAAGAIAEVLGREGMSGFAMTDIKKAQQLETEGSTGGLNSLETRRNSLREILLARTLFRCGDKDGIGKKILEQYQNDLRGHFARHAHAVLQK